MERKCSTTAKVVLLMCFFYLLCFFLLLLLVVELFLCSSLFLTNRPWTCAYPYHIQVKAFHTKRYKNRPWISHSPKHCGSVILKYSFKTLNTAFTYTFLKAHWRIRVETHFRQIVKFTKSCFKGLLCLVDSAQEALMCNKTEWDSNRGKWWPTMTVLWDLGFSS